MDTLSTWKKLKKLGYCHASEPFCTWYLQSCRTLRAESHIHLNTKLLVNFDQISCVLIGKDNNGCLKRGVKHANTTTNFLTLLSLISCTHSWLLPLKSVLHMSPQNSRNLFHKSLVLITDNRWLVNISDVSQGKLTGSLQVLYSFLAVVWSITQKKAQF